MTRALLPPSRIHFSIHDKIANHHRDLVEEVESAISASDLVVVGMAQNPFPRKTKALLQSHGIPFRYLEYGSYLSDWRRRTVLKMWTGWPTFPMVFVKGTLIGGFEDTERLLTSGELRKMLDAPRGSNLSASSPAT